MNGAPPDSERDPDRVFGAALQRIERSSRRDPLDLVAAAAALVAARRRGVREVDVVVDDGAAVRVRCEVAAGMHPATFLADVGRLRSSGEVLSPASVTAAGDVWIRTPAASGPVPDPGPVVRVDLDARTVSMDGLAGDTGAVWLEQFVDVASALAAGHLPHLGAVSLARSREAGPERLVPPSPLPSVLDGIRRQVLHAPGEVAVSFRGESIHYGDLWRRVGELAGTLSEAGARRGDRVAIVGHRSPGTLAAMLATWAVGGVAVPIDQVYPAQRRRVMIEASDATLVVTVGAGGRGAATGEQAGRAEFAIADVWNVGEGGSPGGGAADRPDWAEGLEMAGHDDPAYVFFTSGSTGVPKAVLGTHGALRHFLDWQAARFGIGPGDRVAVAKPIGFDVILREMLVPLLSGATAVVLPAELGPDDILAWIAGERITILNATPSHVSVWLAARPDPPPLPTLRWVFFAGELLRGEVVERLRAVPAFRGEVVNLYGPTETTMVRCAYVVPPRIDPGVVPVGRPLPGSQVAVLTETGMPAGIDEIGEVVIRTVHGTLGYLNAPDEEASRFRALECGIEYRTGDLGRIRPDGELVVTGRADDQVQILGMRIEPGEVAGVLTGHPAVVDAAVLVEPGPQVPRLVAHLVGDAPDDELIEYLLARLPSPMVPTRLVRHDRLPLTAHGKVDRRALAGTAPEGQPASASAGRPRPAVSSAPARLPAGDPEPASVPAAASSADIGSRLVELRTRIESLGRSDRERVIDELRRRSGVAGDPAAAQPLSFAQTRLWFLDRLHPGSPAYNIVRTTRLHGPLDCDALQAAVDGVVERHAILRTRYESRGGEPVQIVDPVRPLPIVHVDLGNAPPEERQALVEETVNRAARRVFDLERGPVWENTLVRSADDDHVLVSAVHHIASDGWSLPILAGEISELYRARLEEREPKLPTLEIQYSDYAARQRRRFEEGELDAELDHWRAELAGDLPVLELPADRPRPPFQTHAGDKLPFRFEGIDGDMLRAVARRARATPFMVSLAVFAATLHRLTGAEDLIVGIPSADRAWEKTAPLIGFFVNTLSIRLRPRPEMAFLDLVGEVRAACLRAYDNREVPFEQVVQAVRPERDPSRSPVFQVMFQHRMGMFGGSYDLPGVEEEPILTTRATAKFDLSCYSGVEDGAFNGIMLYNTDLFDAATVQGMIDSYEDTVRQMMADPTGPIDGRAASPSPISSPKQGPAAGGAPVHVSIAEWARRRPGAAAVVSGGHGLDRAALDRRARQVAGRLRAEGVVKGSRVGIHMAPSADLVAAMLGVMAAGGAYVPLDIDLPAGRKRLILEDSAPVVTLVDDAAAGELLGVPVLEVGAIADPPAEEQVGVGPEDPAYVIYTSGSTGRPKGVVVTHRALTAFSRSYAAEIGLSEIDRVLQFHSISFDSSVEEIFPTLAAGAALVLRAGERIESLPSTLEWLDAREVTIFTVPTAYWHELVRHIIAGRGSLPPSVRAVCIGGEAARPDAVAAWRETVGRSVMLVNNYGPTETTVIATSARLDLLDDPGDRHVTIGAPLAGVRVHVLDGEGAPVAQGDVGELCIAGDQVAAGYHRMPDLTAARFVPEPGGTGARMYRTGDRVRVRPDGLIEYLGRADRQVKVRGHRVELDEVEHVVRRRPGVREAAVELDREGDRLVAHVVAEDGLALEGLPGELADELPGAMVPVIRFHAELPTSHAGKVDRSTLIAADPPAVPAPAPGEERPAPPQVVSSDAVELLRGVWAEVLSVERVSDDDDFFDLGGHSLLAVRLLSEVEARLGPEVSIRVLFESSRFGDFADRVAGASPALRTDPSPGGTAADAHTGPPDPSSAPPVAAAGVDPSPAAPVSAAPFAGRWESEAVELLRGVWAEVLSVERVSDDDDFFDLGGHSLLAVRLLSEVEARLGAEVSIRVLFESSRFGDFAARVTGNGEVEGSGGRAVDPPPTPDDHPVPGSDPDVAPTREGPLSFAQERLWAGELLAPTAYHVPWGTRLVGPFDLEAFRTALDGVVARHEALRTRFPTDRGTPRQVVDPPGPVDVAVHDLSDLPTAVREERLAALVAAHRSAPFDLVAGPVLRVMVVRLGGDETAIQLVVHHIAVDGRSMRVVRSELADRYEAVLSGRSLDLPQPALTPLDHALRQRRTLEEGGYQRALEHWERQLRDAPARLDLPHDMGAGRPVADHVRFRIPGAAAPIGELGSARSGTPFMVVLAGLAALLARYTGATDLVVGSPMTERTDEVDTVGLYMNTLPLRIDTGGAPTFAELVDRVRDVTIGALEHRAVPIDLALARAGGGTVGPSLEVVYDLKHAGSAPLARFGPAERAPLGVGRSGRLAKYRLTVNAVLGAADLSVGIEYDAGRLSPAAAEALAGHFRTLLEAALDRPDTPVDRLPLLDEEERRLALDGSARHGRRARPLPDADLYARFEAMVQAAPDRPALVGTDSRTYRELHAEAEALAARLAGEGVAPGTTVGLLLERGADLVVATLAVVRRGAAYVPLDPAQPEHRRRAITADAGVTVLLSAGLEITRLREPGAALPAGRDGTRPVYVMYTSGSTGTPKGVVVTAGAVANLVLDTDYVELGPGEVVALASNPAFDAVTFELWGALLNGASLAVLDPDTVVSPAALAAAVDRHGITTMFVTTALFDVMARVRPAVFSGLRTLLFGGEAVNPAAVRRVLDAGPPQRLLHVYGPTETTTFASWHRVDGVDESAVTVPIGGPVAGASLHVLDAHLQPVPPLVTGELYIGGAGLADGYLGAPELTDSRFVAVEGATHGRLYRTGDLVRRRIDGPIEFVGRADRQIKLRGLRIEPGEIEAALLGHPGVAGAVVADAGEGDLHHLVAHVVPHRGVSVGPDVLQSHLAEHLPPYMVPTEWRMVDELPLTPNGKVDMAALRSVRPPGAATGRTGPAPTPQTREAAAEPADRRMLDLWRHTLGAVDIAADTDFFAAGGTSLSAVKLLAGVEELFGVTVPLSRLFEARTPARLLELVSVSTGRALTSRHLVPIQPEGDGPPLFCLPPGGGNVFVYAPLARHLGPVRPMFGLPARGSDGLQPPLRTVEEMAVDFLDAIDRAQPEGPVHLLGYSMAGLVAFEVARKLEESGRTIGLLGLIDTSFPRNEGPAERLVRYVRIGASRTPRAGARAAWVDLRSPLGKLRYGPRWALHAALGRPVPPRLVEKRLTHAGMAAYHAYRPQPYRGDIVYFRATGVGGGGRRRPDRPWSEVARSVEVFDVRGEHAGPRALVEEPYAAEMAEHLRRILGGRT